MSDLLAELISCFDTERLASQVDLRSTACCLLRGSSEAAQNFWTHEEGINIIWTETVAQFPLEMVSLLELSKAVALSGDENKQKVFKK